MNILIVNCHWGNRGDESAIRAMIDELQCSYPNANIYVQAALGSFDSFPENEKVRVIPTFPGKKKRRLPLDLVSIYTKGLINISSEARVFFETLKKADIVLHAPGGPSIGDLYLPQERYKLWRLDLIRRSGVPYVFYAPSMGPFKNESRNKIRRKVLLESSLLCLREEISEKMVNDFIPEKKTVVTLDSAFQHPIDMSANEKLFWEYHELASFVENGDNVIGMTITDLQWNYAYSGNVEISNRIRNVFSKFIEYLTENGYKILFIPQLFGESGDARYMLSFCTDNCFVMSDKYDCYFQQYVISRVKAVVGMRYHSNIFSAKMGTPFISVSYEQKMLGFMKKADLLDYCIDVNDLSYELLVSKFNNLLDQYSEIHRYLEIKKDTFRNESHKTTDLVMELIGKKQRNK